MTSPAAYINSFMTISHTADRGVTEQLISTLLVSLLLAHDYWKHYYCVCVRLCASRVADREREGREGEKREMQGG